MTILLVSSRSKLYAHFSAFRGQLFPLHLPQSSTFTVKMVVDKGWSAKSFLKWKALETAATDNTGMELTLSYVTMNTVCLWTTAEQKKHPSDTLHAPSGGIILQPCVVQDAKCEFIFFNNKC